MIQLNKMWYDFLSHEQAAHIWGILYGLLKEQLHYDWNGYTTVKQLLLQFSNTSFVTHINTFYTPDNPCSHWLTDEKII